MVVIGAQRSGAVTVLGGCDNGLDEERISRGLGGNEGVGWEVQGGLDKLWETLEGMAEINREVEITTQGQISNLQVSTFENVIV